LLLLWNFIVFIEYIEKRKNCQKISNLSKNYFSINGHTLLGGAKNSNIAPPPPKRKLLTSLPKRALVQVTNTLMRRSSNQTPKPDHHHNHQPLDRNYSEEFEQDAGDSYNETVVIETRLPLHSSSSGLNKEPKKSKKLGIFLIF
jgi:hypothetical protein